MTSIHAAVETNRVGRWLLDHGFAPIRRFLTQVYVAEDQLSAAHANYAVSKWHRAARLFAMPALNKPLNDRCNTDQFDWSGYRWLVS